MSVGPADRQTGEQQWRRSTGGANGGTQFPPPPTGGKQYSRAPPRRNPLCNTPLALRHALRAPIQAQPVLSYFPHDLGVRIKTQSLLPRLVTWINTTRSRSAKQQKKKVPENLTDRRVYNATIKLAYALDPMLKRKARAALHKPRPNAYKMEAKCLCDDPSRPQPELKLHRTDEVSGMTTCTGCGLVVSMNEMLGELVCWTEPTSHAPYPTPHTPRRLW
mmetsp:Transcript_31255/g.72331  ORF Transcript_31255/g.72331 Transcript_31255/m.72331 type:complete len:219 (+) Transcript_31255:360-1016(+)